MTLDTTPLPSLITVSCTVAYNMWCDKFTADMPLCNGVEATRRLRILENLKQVSVKLPSKSMHDNTQLLCWQRHHPVVALSADCQDSTKKLCLSAGMDAFFSKPLKTGALQPLMYYPHSSLSLTVDDMKRLLSMFWLFSHSTFIVHYNILSKIPISIIIRVRIPGCALLEANMGVTSDVP